jgi:hypothetical protein
MKKLGLISKIGKFVAFLVFFYQVIESTITYLNYETVVDMKLGHMEFQRPAFSLCLKNKDKFPENKLKFASYNFDHIIGCFHFNHQHGSGLLKDDALNCSKLTRIVESLTSHSHRCLSYFSRLFDKNFSAERTHRIVFLIPDSINVFGLIHQSGTPPHFTRNKMGISSDSLIQFDYSSIKHELLPFPYETNCYDYEREQKSMIGYKSREDCVVKRLERRELVECGCNKRWTYWGLSNANLSHICPQTVKCYLNLKPEMSSLEKICRKNCLNQHFFNIITNGKYEPNLKLNMMTLFTPGKMDKNELMFTHLPKMYLIDYFCSIGGLISMWFGLSVYDLVLIFIRKTNKTITKSLQFIVIFKFRKLFSLNYKQIFSRITIIVFSSLMLWQIITIIISYFEYETVTRFEVRIMTSIPTIRLIKESSNNLQMVKELIEIYPEIGLSPEKFLTSKSIETLKMRLLLDNRMDDFQRIVGSEKLIKTCHIVIDNKLINFSKIDLGLINFNGKLHLTNRLNFSLIDKKKIEKITIRLPDIKNIVYNFIAHLSTSGQSYGFIAKKNFKTKLTFSTFSIQKLNSYKYNCIPSANINDFDRKYSEFCGYDCFFKETNETYGCIPFVHKYIYIERDIKTNGYKFCNNSYSAESIDEMQSKCWTKCKLICESNNFDIKMEYTKHVLNETILEFIPKKCAKIAYFETWKTNLNHLIYNCGGVCGLWFGLTPVKAVDLIKYSAKVFDIFRVKIIRIAKQLLALFKKLIHWIIDILLRFVRKLFTNLSVFIHDLITLCIRCIQNFFEHFISFVYKLIAISKRCIISIITVFFTFGFNLIKNLSIFSYNLIALCIRCVRKSFELFIRFVYQLSVNFKILIDSMITILYRFFRKLFVNLSLITYNFIALIIRGLLNLFTHFIGFFHHLFAICKKN